MKNYISLCCFLLLLISCKENSNAEKNESNNATISSVIENAKKDSLTNPLQDGESQNAAYKALKKKTPLTNDQLLAALPEHINGNKKTSEYAYPKSQQLVTGSYGPVDSQYNFSIEDGVGSKAIVRNFFDSFKLKNQGPPETEYVFLERDDYKTIAFLQPKIKRNQISFIYNNRFRISLEGPDSDVALWSYIDFENLKKLDQFN